MLSDKNIYLHVKYMSEIFTSKVHWLIGHCTHFLRLLDGDLTGSPGDDIEVDKRVQDEKQVHGRDRQQVYEARYNAEEFLRMQTRSYEEGTGQGDQEDG